MSEACAVCSAKTRVSGTDKTTATITGGVLGGAVGLVLVASGIAPYWAVITAAAGALIGRASGD